MFRPMTRFLCLIISFQLFWGCNGAQLSLSGEAPFNITGLIVKSFEKVNDFILPTAMAQETGEVRVYNYTDPENVFIIASQKLYKDSKTFSFSLAKKDVEGQVIQVRYAKANADDIREKFEDADEYVDLGVMNVVLDADATFDAALIKEEIKSLASSNPEVIKDLVRNFDSSLDKEILIKGKGSTDDFKSDYLDEKVAELLFQVKNKEIDLKEFITSLEALRAQAKTALVKGGRLECGSPVSVVQTAEFSGSLSFLATDTQTADTFGSKTDLGSIKSAAQGIELITKVNNDIQKTVNAKGFTAIAYYSLKDEKNKIVSQCKFSIGPKAPEASSVFFDKFDISIYGNVDEALPDIDVMYDETINQLRKDFEVARISTKTDLFYAQVKIINIWHNDLVVKSETYFMNSKSKKKRFNI